MGASNLKYSKTWAWSILTSSRTAGMFEKNRNYTPKRNDDNMKSGKGGEGHFICAIPFLNFFA